MGNVDRPADAESAGLDAFPIRGENLSGSRHQKALGNLTPDDVYYRQRNPEPKEDRHVRKALIIFVASALLTGISIAGETTGQGNVPKVLLLGSLSKAYEPVRFDHAEHISMADGCEDCHHQHRAMQVQACSECHRIDSSFFKKNVNAGKLKPCGECHAVINHPGDRGRLELKAAYHQACFKCHKEEVAGKPEGCTSMCHVPKKQANREGK